MRKLRKFVYFSTEVKRARDILFPLCTTWDHAIQIVLKTIQTLTNAEYAPFHSDKKMVKDAQTMCVVNNVRGVNLNEADIKQMETFIKFKSPFKCLAYCIELTSLLAYFRNILT